MGQAFKERELEDSALVCGKLFQNGFGLLDLTDLIYSHLIVARNVETFREWFEVRAPVPFPGPVDQTAPGNHGHETPITCFGWLISVSALP
jgi:hypothetical protein